MEQQAAMLAALFEKSLNLGSEWKVVDVEFRENLRTGRACMRKEAMRRVYECGSRQEAAETLDALASWMAHSNLAPMKALSKTLTRNREEALAYFDHRRTNSVLEGLNSVIQSVKRAARGCRNFENFKAMIFLHLGKLSLGIPESCGIHLEQRRTGL